MRRTSIVLMGFALIGGAGYGLYKLPVNYDGMPNLWAVATLLCLVGVGVFVIGYGFVGNVYHITEGVVIRHSFEKAHMTQPIFVPGTPANGITPGTTSIYVPGQWLPDTWSLQVQDERGHATWFSFTTDVFDQYPVGSYYKK